ncbi:kinase-like protein, partial [Daedalea quercina L-15889]
MTHEIRTGHSRVYNRRMVNQYEFDHRVGVGQHGEVYLARDTSKNNMPVALKVVKRKNPKADKMSKFRKQNQNLPTSPHLPLTDKLGTTEHKIRKEIAIMKKCNHPHIVKLLEVIDDNLHEKIYMVMEYLGGGEIKWRTNDGEPVLRVDQTRRICRDVILGLEYLHHQGIIHRDIKPSNLLWTADRRTVKIADFGVAHFSYAQRLAAAGQGMVELGDEDPILMDDSELSKTAGTPMFLAPEIVSDTSDPAASSSTVNVNETANGRTATFRRRRQPITKAIDVWAFGVTLYGLLFGHLPFFADREYEIYQVIRRQDWSVDPTMGVDQIETGGRYQRPQPKGQETEGHLVVQLLVGLLEKDARKRITLDQVKRHPWILHDMQDPEQWLRET